MKIWMSFIHDSTVVEQAPEQRHSGVQHCVGAMEKEDLEAQFEDEVALRTDERWWLILMRMGKSLLSCLILPSPHTSSSIRLDKLLQVFKLQTNFLSSLGSFSSLSTAWIESVRGMMCGRVRMGMFIQRGVFIVWGRGQEEDPLLFVMMNL